MIDKISPYEDIVSCQLRHAQFISKINELVDAVNEGKPEEPKLLSCPWCLDKSFVAIDYRINCDGCGSRGPSACDEREAITAWNTRSAK